MNGCHKSTRMHNSRKRCCGFRTSRTPSTIYNHLSTFFAPLRKQSLFKSLYHLLKHGATNRPDEEEAASAQVAWPLLPTSPFIVPRRMLSACLDVLGRTRKQEEPRFREGGEEKCINCRLPWQLWLARSIP